MSGFRLLVIADSHYASCADDVVGSPPARRCDLGCELLRRAIEDANNRGGFDRLTAGGFDRLTAGGFDCLALMGDLLNSGDSPRAGGDLEAVRAQVRAAGDVPLLVVPGNHDGDAGRLLSAFGRRTGLHEISGYRFLVFADEYAGGDLCARSESDRRALLDLAGSGGPPIIVLQHSPMNPAIESDYPYMLTNRAEVMADYAAAGVLLSISGHYHPGQPPSAADGVRYFTAPAVCEAPFSYAIITLRGREVNVELRPLAVEAEPAIIDCHAHTQFAYCAQDVTAEEIIARARTFGLAGQCLTEHAGQLYCSEDDFWAGRHIREPAVWRSDEHSRVAEFRRAMLPLRDEFVRVGLEVGLDADGQLTIRDEDRDWPDLLIGAVHWIVEEPDELNDAQLARAFMRASEGLLKSGVDVLAHPWRFFRRAKRDTPKELYADLAEALSGADTAVEINFHTNAPDPAFFAECIARGVKIALASDAHAMHEAGAFTAHLALLRHAAGRDEVTDLLFYPPAGQQPV